MKFRRSCAAALLVLSSVLVVLAPPAAAAVTTGTVAAGDQVVSTWGSLRYDLSSDGNQRPTRLSDRELVGRTVTDVSEAGISGCAVASGQLFCAGQRAQELAGVGTGPSTEYLPVTAAGLAGRIVTRVSVGDSHSCAIASGAAVCWGDNTYGQLGAGRTSPEEQLPVPVDTTGVLAGKRVTDIAVGQDSTCAVADGRAYCWGHDGYGELGRGGPALSQFELDMAASSARPVAVDTSGVLGGRTISKIGVGAHFACALADGRVACWGQGTLLGDGTGYDAAAKPSPVLVGATGLLAGKTVTDLSVTQGRTCVVAAAEPYCWGYNSNLSLGANLTVSEVHEPVAVATDGALAGRTVSRIVGGLNFACVLADGGGVFCWGNGLDGAVGDGGGERNVPTPVAVDRTGPLGVGPVQAIFAGTSSWRMVSVNGGPEPTAEVPATLSGDGRGSSAPVGNLDGGSLSGTSYQLEGWSLDPDAPGAVGTVHVWDYPQSGAARGVVATAGPSRPDIEAAFPGAGSGHGFWAQLRLSGPGRHRVCAFAIDAPGGGGGNTLLGCREVDAPGVAGSLDVVANTASGHISVLGWAADPDDPVRHQEIHVYVTGPAGQVGQPGIWTGHQRLDVARAFGWAGMRSGWQVDMPTEGTGLNKVCAFAIDRSEPKINQLLGCRTIDVRDPFGSLDAAMIRGTSPGAWLRVQAWGIDPNLPGQRTLVDFDIRQPDGTSVPYQSYLTGSARPDVEAAFPGLGANSGIGFETQVDQVGTYTVCASAVSSAGGHGRAQFGCHSFEVS